MDVSTAGTLTYDLKVQNGDTIFEISVKSYIYYDFEINDTILLSKYSGFFNESYYIYE